MRRLPLKTIHVLPKIQKFSEASKHMEYHLYYGNDEVIVTTIGKLIASI